MCAIKDVVQFFCYRSVIQLMSDLQCIACRCTSDVMSKRKATTFILCECRISRLFVVVPGEEYKLLEAVACYWLRVLL